MLRKAIPHMLSRLFDDQRAKHQPEISVNRVLQHLIRPTWKGIASQ